MFTARTYHYRKPKKPLDSVAFDLTIRVNGKGELIAVDRNGNAGEGKNYENIGKLLDEIGHTLVLAKLEEPS